MSGDCIEFSMLQWIMLVQNSAAITELSKQLTKWGTNLMGGSHLHIRCMTHIVKRIVQDGIKKANVSIERVRETVIYIRQSPARWKKFQECCEDENLAKKVFMLGCSYKVEFHLHNF